jgi:hypothetical protein
MKATPPTNETPATWAYETITWIPVADRLPEVSGQYLTFTPKTRFRKVRLAEYRTENASGVFTRYQSPIGATHWAEVPKGPFQQ